jgi:hypothetical protein
VRKQLGIQLRGEGNLLRLHQGLYHAPDLFDRIPIGHGPGKGRHYHIADGQSTFLIMQDSTKHWTLHAAVEKPEDMAAQFERTIGIPVPYEMLYVGEWKQNLLLADAYGAGRVFLAGDAVHVMPPNGGLGMNTGIGDAVDLGWKLAAVHEGWGGEHLLASYEPERRPTGMRACAEAMKNFERITPRRTFAAIHDDSAEGREVRRELGAKLAHSMRNAWDNPLNTHLGYRYDGSPICVPDGPPPPEPADSRVYVQSSHPGGRAPHASLADGRSTLDLFGRGFTLLEFSSVAHPFAEEARRRRLPLEIVRIQEAAIAELYERKLVLVRPDGHVAWRADTAPADAGAVLDCVRGAVRSPVFEEETS